MQRHSRLVVTSLLFFALGPTYAGVKEGVDALARRDYAEARHQFESVPSDPEGLYQLARMAQFGLGEPADASKATSLYGRAWEAGHQNAGLTYGRYLVLGVGVPKDEAAGMAIIRKLAEAGMGQAQYLYGLSLEQGQYGLQKDEASGVEWLRKAMDAGNTNALVQYANALSLGRGVPKDEARAVQILQAAAARGDPTILVTYGQFLAAGRGVEKNQAEAFKLFKRAADMRLPRGQLEVGRAYVFGIGVVKDPAEGARWIDAAARNGDVIAQWTYGELFRFGTGVPASLIQAYKWYQIAYNQSGGAYERANESRALLAARMSSAQINVAVRQASEYRVERNVQPTAKLAELARGDRVQIGGRTVSVPLPDGFVNAWEIAERIRRARPNADSWDSNTLLVGMASKDIDRMKMGLHLDEVHVLEFHRYIGDDTVNVTSDLFADMRKQVRERIEAKSKAATPAPGPSEQIVRDDDQGVLMLRTVAPTGESVGSSIGVALLRLNERAAYVYVIGAPGTADGQAATTSLLKDWVSVLLRNN